MHGALMNHPRPALEAAAQKSDPRAGKYLIFRLGKEEFAIKVSSLREIMGIQEITGVPQTPAYVKGVINLRGILIPVIDLRLKFGLPEIPYTSRTCIVVVQIDGERGKILLGAVVDSVSEVSILKPAEIEDLPDSGDTVPSPYLVGMVKTKGKVKILLDMNMVLTAQESHRLSSVRR